MAEGLLSRFVDIPILWSTDVGNETRADLARVSETDLHHNLGTTHISGLTSAQLALAWMLKKHDWIVPIPSAIKSVYLYENLESTQLKLSAEQMRTLERAQSADPTIRARRDWLRPVWFMRINDCDSRRSECISILECL